MAGARFAPQNMHRNASRTQKSTRDCSWGTICTGRHGGGIVVAGGEDTQHFALRQDFTPRSPLAYRPSATSIDLLPTAVRLPININMITELWRKHYQPASVPTGPRGTVERTLVVENVHRVNLGTAELPGLPGAPHADSNLTPLR